MNRRMPNGMYGGVRGERKSPLLNFAGRGSKALLPAEEGYETNIEKGS